MKVPEVFGCLGQCMRDLAVAAEQVCGEGALAGAQGRLCTRERLCCGVPLILCDAFCLRDGVLKARHLLLVCCGTSAGLRCAR